MMLKQRPTAAMEGLCQRDKLNARALLRWTFVWGVTWVVVALFFGPGDRGLASISPWMYGLLVIPLAACVAMIKAYLRFLREADELVRLVLLRAAAIGFGVAFALGFVFLLSSQMFGEWEDAGAITWGAGWLAYQISFSWQWKHYDVQPSA